jgi:hypothetical protein
MRRAVKQYSCPETQPTPRKAGGSGIKQPPVQWPGQEDGLPLPENMQGTLTNRQAHQRCPRGRPTTRGAGCGRSRIMRRAVRQYLPRIHGQHRGSQGRRASSDPGTMAKTRGWPTPTGKYARSPRATGATTGRCTREVSDRWAHH